MLTQSAWTRAILLCLLSRAGLPLSARDMGAALLTDLTAIHKELRTLREIGAVGCECGRDKRLRYFASHIVRMTLAA